MEINLLDYTNRFDASKRYSRHLFRNCKVVQAAEFNEIQDAAHLRLKSVADTLYSDGDIVSGCEIGVDINAGLVKLGAGLAYIDGEVHSIAAAEIPLPPDKNAVVGVWLTKRTVTEIQDGSLRDPVIESRNYNEPGAARRQIATFWVVSSDPYKNELFYALHVISDGEVVRTRQA